ncbi:Peroxiredoxin [Pedobacter steynii]|uniref:Peroxiredoxin n=1 Tax=Pedobacter steynii TaxID=430522 RepID=A0A1G9P6C0_9SPHI|nr:TlpA disulfide reductase family protein [Pedobacter steynii]NQX39081.1 AhpC/TSA family protein [Pedobacter steynii]SDL94279.1 Peroxiredoxin [Pedobacter steynii]
MKKIFLLGLFAFPFTVWAQNGIFLLTGQVGQESAPAKVYLNYQQDGQLKTLTSAVVKGAFQFKGTLTDPKQAQLVFDHEGTGMEKLGRTADVKILFLEKGSLLLSSKDSVKNASISGSPLNETYKRFQALMVPSEKAMRMVELEYRNAPEAKQKSQQFQESLQSKLMKLSAEQRVIILQYAKKNPTSFLSLHLLTQLASPDMDTQVMRSAFNALSTNLRGSKLGKELVGKLGTASATAVGGMAPNFTQNDVNGKPVKLSDFKGKYVLLDFWASWCVPCRAQHPNLVKTYNKYKGKNFTILGVSLDDAGKKADWLKAIKSDGLTWTQVSDLKFRDNEVAKLYNINAIPQNFLIDPSGKIIGKNLHGEELNKKLASIFK